MFKVISIPLLALLVILTGCGRESTVAPLDETSPGEVTDPVDSSRDDSVDPENVPHAVDTELLARIEKDGGKVDFHLVAGKAFLVTSLFPGTDKNATPLATLGPEAAKLKITEIYEVIAGAPAPQELVEAQELIESDADKSMQPGRTGAESGGSATGAALAGDATAFADDAAAKMSASSFTSTYCYSGGDFHECLTDRTVGDTFNSSCWYMYFAVNTVSGQVGQKLRVKVGSSYVTAGFNSLPAGYIGEMAILNYRGLFIGNRYTRAIVNNVSGSDEYHVAIWGLF